MNIPFDKNAMLPWSSADDAPHASVETVAAAKLHIQREKRLEAYLRTAEDAVRHLYAKFAAAQQLKLACYDAGLGLDKSILWLQFSILHDEGIELPCHPDEQISLESFLKDLQECGTKNIGFVQLQPGVYVLQSAGPEPLLDLLQTYMDRHGMLSLDQAEEHKVFRNEPGGQKDWLTDAFLLKAMPPGPYLSVHDAIASSLQAAAKGILPFSLQRLQKLAAECDASPNIYPLEPAKNYQH